jgi:hypothetical protein
MRTRCSHPRGGVDRCRYCHRRTCADCHHSPQHLAACPDTARRETRRR